MSRAHTVSLSYIWLYFDFVLLRSHDLGTILFFQCLLGMLICDGVCKILVVYVAFLLYIEAKKFLSFELGSLCTLITEALI